MKSWLRKAIREGTVTVNPVKIMIPQAQDSPCPKCGVLANRFGFMTDGTTLFGCGNGHDFVNWDVPPKELVLSESDLVGLLLAWHFGNVPECCKVVQAGTMLTEEMKEKAEK